MAKLIAILGPTGIGKSNLAIQLAKSINSEIINFDIYQMYKELSIGVNKPSADELNAVKHHFINNISLNDNYTIYHYQKECRHLIQNLNDKGIIPILTGGSNLYFSSVIYNYVFNDHEKADISKFLNLSNEQLYEYIKTINPISLHSIHVNNRKRLLRVIEILESGNEKVNDSVDLTKPLYDCKIYILNLERTKLYEKTDKRVDMMFDLGLENEVRDLYSKYDNSINGLRAIGYKEFEHFFSNSITLDELKNQIKLNTRHYIKRQETWLNNKVQGVKVDYDNALKYILDDLKENI